MNLLPVKKLKEGIHPIKQCTAYKWHSKGKYPNLIYKVAGVLVLDLEELERMSKKAQQANIKKRDRIFSSLEGTNKSNGNIKR